MLQEPIIIISIILMLALLRWKLPEKESIQEKVRQPQHWEKPELSMVAKLY